ncbi:MAG TPA: sulfatase-like hydrolase/transferase, partial [Thermoleophilaceae bacterium]|nr:sulfatase-like hydrolase/transferase [Thermoleophilaceae bacterium]
PALDFLHVAFPHWPWQYLPSGQQYPTDTTRIPGQVDSKWVRDSFQVEQGYQRYLLQLEYVDRLVQRLIARLRGEGLWDRALVVVAADHGVSFRPGQPRRRTTKANFADIASVPLFVKAPGQETGRIDDSPVRTIDILPTVEDLLELRSGWRYDGRSARRGIVGRQSVAVLTGDEVRMDFDEFRAMRNAEVRRRIGLFGSGAGGVGAFALGTSSELVGGRPEAFPDAPAGDLRAEIEDQSLLEDVETASPALPAYVRGRITGGRIAPGTSLAVSLNGSIQAVVPAYADGGELRFGAILRPGLFRDGRNSVALYLVGGADGAPTLATLRGSSGASVAGRLVGEDGALRIKLARTSLDVVPDALAGFVDKLEAPDPLHLRIAGWAADPKAGRRAGRVLVFAGRTLIGSGPTGVARLDVAEDLGRLAVLSGYRLDVIHRDAEQVAGDPSRVRVFGVLGGRASELRYSESARRP